FNHPTARILLGVRHPSDTRQTPVRHPSDTKPIAAIYAMLAESRLQIPQRCVCETQYVQSLDPRSTFARCKGMSRSPRVFLPGISVHVIQRGNNRMNIFRERSDYEVFLGFLARALRGNRVSLHAYVLMTTHVHFIVTPTGEANVPRMMQQLSGHYVRF